MVLTQWDGVGAPRGFGGGGGWVGVGGGHSTAGTGGVAQPAHPSQCGWAVTSPGLLTLPPHVEGSARPLHTASEQACGRPGSCPLDGPLRARSPGLAVGPAALMGTVTWPLVVPTHVRLLRPCLPRGSRTPLSWEGRGPRGPWSPLPRACHPSRSGTRPRNKPPFKELDPEAPGLEPRPALPHPVPAPASPSAAQTRGPHTHHWPLSSRMPPFALHPSVNTARNAPL